MSAPVRKWGTGVFSTDFAILVPEVGNERYREFPTSGTKMPKSVENTPVPLPGDNLLTAQRKIDDGIGPQHVPIQLGEQPFECGFAGRRADDDA